MKRFLLLTILSIIAIAAYALQLSEFIVTPTGSEAVEIHNEAGTTLDLTGYKIILTSTTWSDTGTFAAYTMAANEYKSYAATTLFTRTISNDGLIIKIINPSNITIDSVAYGFVGPAPQPIYNFSTARVASTGDMANDWNMDLTPTMGSPNDAASVNLGSGTVFFNEVYPDTFATQFIELYNSSASPVDISNWFIVCDDDHYFPASTSVPANGYLVIYDTDWLGGGATYFYLDPSENLYLYNATGVRIDQFGFTDVPQDSSFAVIPNGVRTVFDGYTSATSPDFEVYVPTPDAVNPVETDRVQAFDKEYSVFSMHGTGIGIRNISNAQGTIEITDISGRVLYSSFLKNMNFITNSGVYFVHIVTENGSAVTKTAVIK